VKKRIFIIILILLLVGIGYVYASDQGWLPKNAPKLPIKNLPKISTDSASLNTIQKNAGSGLSTLSERAQELGENAKNALQTGIQVDSEQPVHERVIEYGQYVYCKQVVEEFEKNIISPTPTP